MLAVIQDCQLLEILMWQIQLRTKICGIQEVDI